MWMAVKRSSQKKGFEQLFQHFMHLGQFVFREGERVSILLFDCVSGHRHSKCMEVFACQ